MAFSRLFISTGLFLAITTGCPAQLHWNNADQEFGNLPKGIRVFKSTDSINGRPSVAWYVEIKLKRKKLDLAVATGNGKRYTPSQFFDMEHAPSIVVNCSFFSFETNQSLNVLMNEGRMLAYNLPSIKSKQSDSFYYPTRSALGISRNRKADVAWIFTDTAQRWPYAFQQNPIVAKGKKPDPEITDLQTRDYWEWWRKQTAVGGGPVLLQRGKIRITNKEEQMFVNGENDRHPRTAMGYTGNHRLIIMVIQGRSPGIAEGATLLEEARILKNLKCKEALNLDGGGSSCLLINGKETIQPSDKTGQRPVPAVFMVKKRSRHKAN